MACRQKVRIDQADSATPKPPPFDECEDFAVVRGDGARQGLQKREDEIALPKVA